MRNDSEDEQQPVENSNNKAPSNPLSGFPSAGPELDDGVIEGPNYTSNWNAFLGGFKSETVDSATVNNWKAWRLKNTREDTTSPVATQDDIDFAKSETEGLSAPDGVRVNTLKALQQDKDSENYNKFLLSQAKPTFLGKTAELSGALIGSVITNPVATGAAIAAGILTRNPDASLPILATEGGELGNALIKFGINKAIQGGAEFGAFTAVQEIGKKTLAQETGEEYDAFHGLLNIAESGVIGAPIQVFGEFIPAALFNKKVGALFEKNRKAFGNRQAEDGAQVALDKIRTGKDPSISLSYRYGIALSAKIFQDDMKFFGVDADEAGRALIGARDEITEKHQPILDEVTRQDDLLNKHNLNIPLLKMRSEELKQLGKLDELKLSRTQQDSLNLERRNLTLQISKVAKSKKDIVREITRDKPSMTREQKGELADKMLKERLEPLQNRMDNIDNEFDRFDKFKDAQKRVSQIDNETKPFLKDISKKQQSIDDYLNDWQDLQAKHMNFLHLKASTGLFDHFINTDETELPNDAVNDFINDQQKPEDSFKETGGFDKISEPGRDFKNPEHLLNDTYPDSMQKEILPDEEVLSKDEKKDFDDVKDAPRRATVFKNAVSTMIMCILGSET